MIPLAIVQAVITLLIEVFRAFNALDPDQRRKIVDQLLNDDTARRSAWDKFTAWVSGLVAKVKM